MDTIDQKTAQQRQLAECYWLLNTFFGKGLYFFRHNPELPSLIVYSDQLDKAVGLKQSLSSR